MSPSRPAHSLPPPVSAAPPRADRSSPFESWHAGDTPEVRDRLEALDDAMFAAIGGNEGALAKARELWREAAAALPWELVDESREQYLRYASEVTRRFEVSDVRDPAAAIAALEVIELLTRE